MPFWIVLFICVVVAYFAVTEGAKKYFDMKLQVLFNLGLYQDCIDLLDRKLARIVMSTYKQYYLRFTIYEAADMDAYAARMTTCWRCRAAINNVDSLRFAPLISISRRVTGSGRRPCWKRCAPSCRRAFWRTVN